jgi:negative regulator of sigma E activity
MKVSMLLDDELTEREALSLLDQIEYDERLRDKWFRYNTASLAIKVDSAVALQPDLVDSVRRAISCEPVVFSVAAAPRPARRFNGFAAALAVSLVIVAVVIVRQTPEAGKEAERMVVAGKDAVSSADGAQPVSAAQSPEEARLHGYLLNHSESAYSMGTLGMLPYARVVSYGADRE